MREKICVGIVTYNPEEKQFFKCFKSVLNQENVDRVYIFDNGSQNREFIKYKIEKYKKVEIIYSEYNVGIAKALNEICKRAEKQKYNWILTMDQDSICERNMLKNMLPYADIINIGIVAPAVEFRVNNILIHETKNKHNKIESIRACITSGSLMNIEAWKKVSGFNEWMFIDHVDNDICTNMIINGYKIIRVNDALLYQRAGEMNYINFFGKKILLPNYSKTRNYYICRNTVYYLKKYKKYINYKHELITFIYSIIVKLLFEKNKIATIMSTFKGISDGMKSSNEVTLNEEN